MSKKTVYVENDYSPQRLRREFKVDNYDDLLSQILESLKDNDGNKLSENEKKELINDFAQSKYNMMSIEDIDVFVLSDMIKCPQNGISNKSAITGSAFSNLAIATTLPSIMGFGGISASSGKGRYYEWA